MSNRELLDSSKLRQSAYEIPSIEVIDGHFEDSDKIEYQVGEDFTSEELIRLKRQLSKGQNEKALQTLKENPILHSFSLYSLFTLYFGLIYENEQVYNLILEEEWKEEDKMRVTRIEQKAWDLISCNGYEQIRKDRELKKLLSLYVMYKALDFNIKEVFSLVFEQEDSLILREEDIQTLLKYKHYKEIVKTFNKPILKRNILELFLEQEGNFKQDQHYTSFNLNYFMEVMIRLEYSNFEIRDFASHFIEHFNPNQAIRIFIKYDRIDLVQWADHHNNYKFNIEQVILSFEVNALDITKYFILKYKKNIFDQRDTLRKPIIDSFGQSVLLYEYKVHFMKKYFKIFSAKDLETFLIILRDNLLSEEYDKSPFLYCLNPIRTGLLLVELLREISEKFKIFQVRCMELEKYLEESLFKFIDGIQNEEISSFMLLEKDWDNRDSLELLSKFEFYRIIQHRNVNEVVMQIFKSKYALEVITAPYPLTNNLLHQERILNQEDIEKKYRPPNIKFDRRNSKQSAFMFHIYRYNILSRYNSELASIVLLTLAQVLITIFVLFQEQKEIEFFPVVELISAQDPIIYSEDFQATIVKACSQNMDSVHVFFICIRGISVLFILQLAFGVKLLSQFLIKWKTGRKIQFITLANLIYVPLTAGALFLCYLAFRETQQMDDPFFEFCKEYVETTAVDQARNYMIKYFYEWQYTINILYAFNIMLLLCLILLNLRMTLQLGPLIKIMISIGKDFLLMVVLIGLLLELYQQIGYCLFLGLEEFSSNSRSFQVLFAAVQGNFNLAMFDLKEGQDPAQSYSPVVGKVYLISWLVISNIMMLNLLIAIFSNTYNQLQQEKYGQFLKQIIDSRPNLEYDEEYGALIVVPFPLNICLLPLLPFYALIQKNKYFNEVVETVLYFGYLVFVDVPFLLFIWAPVKAFYLYFKCSLNKLYILILAKSANRSFCDKFTSVIVFLIVGFPYFLILCIADFILLWYTYFKPEDQLQLRYQRDQIQLTLEDVNWIKHFNCFIKKSKNSIQKKTFEYMKVFVSKLGNMMKIEESINKILHQGSSENDPNLQNLKVYARVKAMFVDSSIRDNGQLVIYPTMLDAVIEDIHISNKFRAISENLTKTASNSKQENNLFESDIFQGSSKHSHLFKEMKKSEIINCNQVAIDGKVRSLAKHLIMAQIGNAARSFLRRDNWAQQNSIEIALNKDNQAIKQSIEVIKNELQTKLNIQ